MQFHGTVFNHSSFPSEPAIPEPSRDGPIRLHGRQDCFLESSFAVDEHALVIAVKMANHGLIAMQGVNLSFEDHDTFELKPLIENVGTIAAQSEVIVPVIARYKDASAAQSAGGIAKAKASGASMVQAAAFGASCNLFGSVSGWFKCGPQQIIKSTSLQGYWNCLPAPPPPQPNPSPNTPPQPPNPQNSPGTGGGSGNGSSTSSAPIQITKTENCNCDPPKPDPCPQSPDNTDCVIWVVATPEDECNCETYVPVFLSVPCDDDNDCTVDDKCQNGTCQGTPVQISFGANLANRICAAGSAQVNVTITPDSAQGQVTFESADPSVVTVSGTYPTLTVTATPDAGGKSTIILAKINGTVCSSGGVTVATDACDDGNPCTENDRCVNGVCIGTPIQDATPCDDGNPCTINDQCINGVCQGTPIPNCTSCDDGNPCTTNDRMINGVCMGDPTPNCSPCDDGNDCTVDDRRINGVCQGTQIQIILSPNPLNVAVGATAAIYAHVTPASARGLIRFRSTVPSVATVLGSGSSAMITGVAQGNASIEAVIGTSACASVPVNVTSCSPFTFSVWGGMLGDIIEVNLASTMLTEFQQPTGGARGFVADIDDWQNVLRTQGRFYFVPDALGTSELGLQARCPSGASIQVTIRFENVQDGYSTSCGNNPVTGGSTRLAVFRQQQRLKYFRFPGASGSPLTVDGSLGQNTVWAIRLFNAAVTDSDHDAASTTINLPCINAVNAPRWVLVNPGDDHRYGTSWALEVLNTARVVNAGSAFQVNDVSLPRGGNTPDHSSHEAGMDIDIETPSTDNGNIPFYGTHQVNGTTYVAAADTTDGMGSVVHNIIRFDSQTSSYVASPITGTLQGALVHHSSIVDNQSLLASIRNLIIDNEAAGYDIDDVKAQMRSFANITAPSGAGASSIYYNDPRTWNAGLGINVLFLTDHGGHFHVNIRPAPSAGCGP